MAKPRSARPNAAVAHDKARVEQRAHAAQEAELFRAAVRDVKPLAQPSRVGAPGETRRARRAAAAQSNESLPLVPEEAAPQLTGADALSFRRPGVRTSVLRHLRRGLFPIEDELDLHGLSQAAARESLAEFIAFNRQAGHRCVRIIHGKGYRSGARGPILKIAVNSWLKHHCDVMAFSSARGIDGGTGAVYVLLRA